MEDFRSKSCGNGKFQTDSSMAGPSAFGVNGMQDLRCYSANYSYNAQQQQTKTKAKTTSKSWSLTDPELLRKKRVASYKVYSVEGKVKGSFRKSFRWIKERYTRVVYGSPWSSWSFYTTLLLYITLLAVCVSRFVWLASFISCLFDFVPSKLFIWYGLDIGSFSGLELLLEDYYYCICIFLGICLPINIEKCYIMFNGQGN